MPVHMLSSESAPHAAGSEESRHKRAGVGVLVAGGLLAGLGIAAVTFPYLASFAVELVIALLVAASGLVQLYQAFALRRAPNALRRGISGLLWLAAGVLYLAAPFGQPSLRDFVAVLIGVDGVLRIVDGARRRFRDRGWVWLIIGGASSLGLATLIAAGLPQGYFWATGLLLGITLVIDGAALVLNQRRAAAGDT